MEQGKKEVKENQEDIKHILENIFDCDPEDKEDSAFIQLFQFPSVAFMA